jgi:hypothetical protein
LVTSVDDADPLLKAIGKGETAGAPRLLERAYARSLDDEAAAADALREAIEGHPAWPWLSNIKGIGHLLSARLLSRLDVLARKRHPRSGRIVDSGQFRASLIDAGNAVSKSRIRLDTRRQARIARATDGGSARAISSQSQASSLRALLRGGAPLADAAATTPRRAFHAI